MGTAKLFTPLDIRAITAKECNRKNWMNWAQTGTAVRGQVRDGEVSMILLLDSLVNEDGSVKKEYESLACNIMDKYCVKLQKD